MEAARLKNELVTRVTAQHPVSDQSRTFRYHGKAFSFGTPPIPSWGDTPLTLEDESVPLKGSQSYPDIFKFELGFDGQARGDHRRGLFAFQRDESMYRF